MVDFARIPPEVAWGRATLNPAAVAQAKLITDRSTPGQEIRVKAKRGVESEGRNMEGTHAKGFHH